MKRLVLALVALSVFSGTIVFAQPAEPTKKAEKKKKVKKKKEIKKKEA